MFKYIVDKDIELILLSMDNAKELFDLVDKNRVYLKKWLPWLDSNTNLEDTKQFIKNTEKQFETNNGLQTGIWYKGKLCGVIGFHYIDWANKKTSIGYWLGESFQGRGIMLNSCEAILNYSFKDMKLNRVEIRCAEGNSKSRAIPEKLGFINEGIIRENEWLYNHYVNHIVYSKLSGEWQ